MGMTQPEATSQTRPTRNRHPTVHACGSWTVTYPQGLCLLEPPASSCRNCRECWCDRQRNRLSAGGARRPSSARQARTQCRMMPHYEFLADSLWQDFAMAATRSIRRASPRPCMSQISRNHRVSTSSTSVIAAPRNAAWFTREVLDVPASREVHAISRAPGFA